MKLCFTVSKCIEVNKGSHTSVKQRLLIVIKFSARMHIRIVKQSSMSKCLSEGWTGDKALYILVSYLSGSSAGLKIDQQLVCCFIFYSPVTKNNIMINNKTDSRKVIQNDSHERQIIMFDSMVANVILPVMRTP